MHRRRIPIFLALAVLAVVLPALPLTQAAAIGGATASKLPVVACKTSRGLPSPGGHPVYAGKLTPRTPIPAGSDLTYFTDSHRVITPVLGPRGWTCRVQIGADGGLGFDIYPPGNGPASKEAVDLQYEPACQGCMYGLICALLPKVARHFDSGAYVSFTCTKRPRREAVDWIKGSPDKTGVTNDIVGFEDPPGVKGDGVPSGGKWPANGVLLYKSTKDANAAAVETCTLPVAQQARCTAILNDFVTRDWGMPPHQV